MGLVTGLYRGCGCTGLIALGLLIGGGQAFYTAVTNRKPVEMTCAEYLEKKPEGKWLKLKDCELDNFAVVTRSHYGSIDYDEVYIPLRPVGAPEGTKVHILLASKKPEDLEFAKQANAVEAGDRTRAEAFVKAHRDRILEHRDVEGLIRHGLDDNEKDRKMFSKAADELASDYVLLNEGEHPNMVQGVNLLAAGIAFVILRFTLVSWREKKAAKAAAARAAASPSAPPPLPG
jgi:hypothetical protein